MSVPAFRRVTKSIDSIAPRSHGTFLPLPRRSSPLVSGPVWDIGQRKASSDVRDLEEGAVGGVLDKLAEGLGRIDHAGLSRWSPGARRDVSSAVIGRVKERKRSLPRSVP